MRTPTVVYFAAPLFTQAEWQWNARLAEELRKLTLQVTLPQERAAAMLNGEEALDGQTLFLANTTAIDESDVVLAILDQSDPDSGTCWECGYAYRQGRPIIGLRTDIRPAGDDPNAPVNLMLSRSCKEFIQVPPNRRDDLPWVAQQAVDAITRLVQC